ncbi:MAG TPA: hypothetical protein DCS66_24245 [Flavobacteriaceae bacterium]|nr:hypothetical protein [Flavobacteriaceae bacterium]HAT67671.1 hypothetical protein [Flavobacteriaceae bacterium]
MRKDIEIPIVKDVYVVAVREYNEDFRTYDWNVYIINNGNDPLETVLIVSEGSDDTQTTSRMRHSLKLLPAKSYAKIEFLEDSVLPLNNYFTISYFIENKLFDKRYEFPAHCIIEENAVTIPVMKTVGVMAR